MIDIDAMPRGQQLRVRRTVAGLRLWELAVKVGVNPGRISEIETGRRDASPEEWARIDAALTTNGATR